MKRCALVILAIVLAAGGPAAQDLERLFKAAVNTEMVDRNCKGAIEQYKKVAAGSNRALAAQALLRMAGCHQQLGNAEAQKIYQRVVTEFSDQKDAAMTAAARLASLSSRKLRDEGVVSKRILDVADVFGSISRDGRYVSFMDADTSDLAIRDLSTNATRRLTTHPVESRREFAEYSIFSPDASRLAYAWSNKDGKYELRVISRDGGAPTVLFTNGEWLMPYDWSPDGREILTLIVRPDRTRQLALISAKDGSTRGLRTLDWSMGVPSHAEYSPDGRFVAYDREAAAGDVFVIATDGSRETAITSDTANDRLLGWFPDGRSLLMSSDRSGATGAWAVAVEDGRSQSVPTLVKPDLGDIKSYRLTAAGAFVYALRVGVPDIRLATIDPVTGRAITDSTALSQRPPSGRSWGLWSPDGTRVVYRIAGTMHFGVQDIASGTVQTVPISLSYAERPAWTPDGLSILVRGANLNAREGLFKIDLTGTVQPVDGGEPPDGVAGQVIMSPDQSAIFYRRIDSPTGSQPTHVLVRRELPSGATRDLHVQRNASISSFAISRDGRQFALRGTRSDGTRFFAVIASSGGETRTVLQESDTQATWGGGRFAWSPDAKYLFVVRGPVDKLTGRATLGVWRIAVADGTLTPVGLTPPGLNGVDVSPDGRHLVLDTLETRRELWTLGNLPSMSR